MDLKLFLMKIKPILLPLFVGVATYYVMDDFFEYGLAIMIYFIGIWREKSNKELIKYGENKDGHK